SSARPFPLTAQTDCKSDTMQLAFRRLKDSENDRRTVTSPHGVCLDQRRLMTYVLFDSNLLLPSGSDTPAGSGRLIHANCKEYNRTGSLDAGALRPPAPPDACTGDTSWGCSKNFAAN